MNVGGTFREQADACCKSCRNLNGDGPWCLRCGAEMPGAVTYGDWDRFTLDLCRTCDVEFAIECGELGLS